MTRAVLLDTNFLLVPIQARIDVYDGLEAAVDGPVLLLVPSAVREELERKAATGPGRNTKRHATGAISLLDRKIAQGKVRTLPVEDGGLKVDDLLVCLATRLRDPVEGPAMLEAGGIPVEGGIDGVHVATNDRGLRRKLSSTGITAMCLKGGKIGPC